MDQDELLRLVADHKASVNRVSMEVLQDVFHRMPFGAQIQLASGDVAEIKPFFEPVDGSKRQPGDHFRDVCHFGFDVVGPNWHLEFVVSQSGWGGATHPQDLEAPSP